MAQTTCPYTFDPSAQFRLLADGVLTFHFLFLGFVLLGGLLVLWRPFIAWFHLPCVFWGFVIELKGFVCPLTPLENYLRKLAGETPYTTSFIERYVLPIVYPAHLTRELQIAFAIGVLLLNAAIYAFLVFRRAKPEAPPEVA